MRGKVAQRAKHSFSTLFKLWRYCIIFCCENTATLKNTLKHGVDRDGASTGLEGEVKPKSVSLPVRARKAGQNPRKQKKVPEPCAKTEEGVGGLGAKEKSSFAHPSVETCKNKTQELGFSHIRLHKKAVVIRLLEINRELSVLLPPPPPLIG